jgi:hypothetical protein
LATSSTEVGNAMVARLEQSSQYIGNSVPKLSPQGEDALIAMKHIFSGVPGSKESKLNDRRKLFGMVTELGLPRLFITFNPSKRDQIFY